MITSWRCWRPSCHSGEWHCAWGKCIVHDIGVASGFAWTFAFLAGRPAFVLSCLTSLSCREEPMRSFPFRSICIGLRAFSPHCLPPWWYILIVIPDYESISWLSCAVLWMPPVALRYPLSLYIWSLYLDSCLFLYLGISWGEDDLLFASLVFSYLGDSQGPSVAGLSFSPAQHINNMKNTSWDQNLYALLVELC